MRNVHSRQVDAPAARIGALIDRLSSRDDPVWPAPAWPPLRLDQGLTVGAAGGHGPIRYHVEHVEPGRRVRFRFAPDVPFSGTHELVVESIDAARSRVTHVLEATPTGWSRVTLPLVIRWLHDALIEDLLDNVELAATGRAERPARWSAWVRLLRRAAGPRASKVPIPEEATLLRAAMDHPSLADAYAVSRPPAVTTDPAAWVEAVFHDPPAWVMALLRLRNMLVRVVGIPPGDESAFAVLERTEREALLGTDERHLDFRSSVLVDDRAVTVSTVARPHHAVGRGYLAIVGLIHPTVVRAMLGRAARSMAERAPTAAQRELERRHRQPTGASERPADQSPARSR